ncbi:hypothetical protein FIBSPDRAFT_1055199 [Athelia psychrophila]|uniref:Uncharacterized protein n=1 Tax=Athelia psychrophila TaxID=1759441 RepID=A0A167U3W8_9AGAM|nr:hypothetical protein FIBSPDRAFT_1055199 [Fibularhizoctonia sp. CBS 109695]
MSQDRHCPQCTCERRSEHEQSIPLSPNLDLLQSNCPPTSTEYASVCASIEQIDKELANIDRESARLRTVLLELEARRLELQIWAAGQRSILSASRRLPAELMLEIFFHCLPEFPFKPSPDEAPWLLGGICRFWRSITGSTPQLWSTLTLEISPGDSGKYCDAMTEWLSRSSSRALSLKLTISMLFVEMEEITSHPVFQLALRHCCRWKDVHIYLYSDTAAQSFAGISGKVPLLQSLKVDIPERFSDVTAPGGDADGFFEAPMLRDYSFDGRIHVFDLPWNFLTKIVLGNFYTDDDNLDFLSQCRDVVELDLYVRDPEEGYTEYPPFLLDQLRSLTIESYDEASPRLFGVLSAPTLRHLHLKMDAKFDLWGWLEDTSLHFHPSKFHLTSLVLDFFDLGDRYRAEDLIAFLQHTPDLEHLVLEQEAASEGFEAETCNRFSPDAPGHLLPKLQTLKIEYFDRFPGAAFAEMLDKRLSSSTMGVRPLRSVTLSLSKYSSSTYMQTLACRCLRPYLEQGLDVCVLDSKGRSCL